MSRIPRALVPALLFAAISVNAAGLPDTGQDTCYNETAADGAPASGGTSVASEGGTHPRQDCRYGRDAAAAAGALTKTGGGAKGFDYTKVANNGALLAAGAALGAGAADWACTRDNITGLTWEIKTGSGADMRYADHTYTWYNSDDNTNGGNKGTTSSSTCNAVLRGSPCNTEGFVTAVNALALCSFTDWRMPTRRELLTLVFADKTTPSVEPFYFPNPPASPFWTASSFAPDNTNAWFVDFADGYNNGADKSFSNSVRLVRGPRF
ncbi:MAG: DUF1566 domain-containing protein [Betaproteobacteria bacterium]|nr:DUF1566 domain-containing protein [Betaproteobacteria bacterium]